MIKNLSQTQINKITKSIESELLLCTAYLIPTTIQKTKIRINTQYYTSTSIGITYWKLEDKMYLQINFSNFEAFLEFPLDLKILRNFDSFTKTQLKNINPRLRHLKKTPVTYSNYFKKLLKELV